jgi:hypothetical protein
MRSSKAAFLIASLRECAPAIAPSFTTAMIALADADAEPGLARPAQPCP